MSADPVADAIAANVKRASDDDGSFETYDLDDLIEADKYVKSKAVSNPFLACRNARMIQPGPVQ